LRAEAEKLPPGTERHDLERKTRQAETGAHIDEWLDSPGLPPQNDEGKVRSVAEYLERAAEFEALAATATLDAALKAIWRYRGLLPADRKEREWLIGTGAIVGEQPIDGPHAGRRN